ncbi:MAG: alpha/beta hydrolase [Fuerstiella sp.]|nr:alpha/beta hydrolase [Fuerstiella sp.]
MKRMAFVSVCLLGLASCSRRDRATDSQAPIRVNVGGKQLEILVEGTDKGLPTVILESGLGGRIGGWMKVRESLRGVTRVVSYHRAGIGGSQPGPRPRSAVHIAAELRSALQQLDVNPPYILVGHSIGGLYVRAFAGLHPDEVTALVLADPTMEFRESMTTSQATRRHQLIWRADFERIQNVLDRVHPKMAELAAQSLLSLEPYLSQVPAEKQEASRDAWLTEFANRSRQIEGMLSLMTDSGRREMFATMESGKTVRNHPTGDIPVALLISGKPDSSNDADRADTNPTRSADYVGWARDARIQRYTTFMQLKANGTQMILKDSGHNIPQERPDAVVDAVNWFLAGDH